MKNIISLPDRHWAIRYIDKCIEDNKKISIAILDLDFFTNINDKIGADNGDIVLNKIACFFLDYEVGITASYGSDEFIIIYADFDEVFIAEHVAEMQRAFNKKRFISLRPYEKAPIK